MIPRVLCVLCVSAAIAGAAAEPVTQADLLRRVIDLDRLALPPPAGERTRMFSSYDRASRINAQGEFENWDANADRGQFIRRSEDGWDVMAELTGPGAITRLWSANPEGRIRFVLDGEPVLETAFADLMAGKVEPIAEPLVNGGLNCYFPLGFAAGCRVECRDSTSYYQINTVSFPPGTVVQRFRPDLDDPARAALAEVSAALTDGLSTRAVLGGRRALPVAIEEDLAPGKTMGDSVEGAGTLRTLYVALTDKTDPREPYALHRCVLRVYVDQQAPPVVEAPLADFFGSGFDLARYNSLVMGTDKVSTDVRLPLPDRPAGSDRFLYSFWPMPFSNGLRVEIENRNSGKKGLGLLLYMQIDTRPPAENALRFHARWRKVDPCKVFDYPILEAAGPGRIVGCVLNVDCPRAEWWGEGDDKVWIDGEKFPSYFGTGSEDFLGDAWGLHPVVRPLHGATRVAPYGKNSAYRWLLSDAIAFHKSVRFTLENWQHNKAQDTYYGTVAYWYAPADAQHFFKPLTAADLEVPGLRIPGAIEAEGNVLGTGWGSVMKEIYAGAELSGQAAANITTTEAVHVNVPVEKAGTYRLTLRVNPRRTFDTITIQDTTGATLGTVQYALAAEGMYPVGILPLAKGNNELIVQCTRPAMLDCWILEAPPAETKPAP